VSQARPVALVVAGPAGAGKTTLGRELASNPFLRELRAERAE